MEIHHFYDVNGKYTHSDIADESQLEPGKPLILANATPAALPALNPHEAAVINATLDGWDVVADYVGTEYWLTDGSHHRITELGISPPANALTNRPFVVSDAKLEAARRIQTDCDLAMIAGVTNNALGSDHIYPTKPQDQQNLAAVDLAANIYGVAREPYKFWCTDAAGVWARREHTAAQIIAVGDAVRAHVASNQDRWELKLLAIQAAADLPAPTQADFDAIVWN